MAGINISNIQHFSVGDGDGIRTTVFMKGCNLRCPWCHNPENLTAAPVTLHYKATGRSETLGRSVGLDELLSELLEDRDFYSSSGGGVTFSGGEAMLYAKELLPLVRALRDEGVSVLIDTAGCVPYSQFEKLNPFVSGYLFDLKTADPKKYREIGGDLELVCENLRRLREEGIRLCIRIPLIPDFNCDGESVEAICRALSDIGIDTVEHLPFHRLGSAKYEAMGLDYAYKKREPLTREELIAIEGRYKKFFKTKIEK